MMKHGFAIAFLFVVGILCTQNVFAFSNSNIVVITDPSDKTINDFRNAQGFRSLSWTLDPYVQKRYDFFVNLTTKAVTSGPDGEFTVAISDIRDAVDEKTGGKCTLMKKPAGVSISKKMGPNTIRRLLSGIKCSR